KVAGQSWLIVRGLGGRAALGETLKARGAEVTYWEVYKRIPLRFTKRELRHKLNPTTLSAMIVTSEEILVNLLKLWRQVEKNFKTHLLNVPMIVPSARLVAQAYEHRFMQVIQAHSADN